MYQDGYRVVDPEKVTWEQWQYLLTLKTRKARLEEYTYLGKRVLWKSSFQVNYDSKKHHNACEIREITSNFCRINERDLGKHFKCMSKINKKEKYKRNILFMA